MSAYLEFVNQRWLTRITLSPSLLSRRIVKHLRIGRGAVVGQSKTEEQGGKSPISALERESRSPLPGAFISHTNLLRQPFRVFFLFLETRGGI